MYLFKIYNLILVTVVYSYETVVIYPLTNIFKKFNHNQNTFHVHLHPLLPLPTIPDNHRSALC